MASQRLTQTKMFKQSKSGEVNDFSVSSLKQLDTN